MPILPVYGNTACENRISLFRTSFQLRQLVNVRGASAPSCSVLHCPGLYLFCSVLLFEMRGHALSFTSDFSVCLFCTVFWNERPCALFHCSDFSVCMFWYCSLKWEAMRSLSLFFFSLYVLYCSSKWEAMRSLSLFRLFSLYVPHSDDLPEWAAAQHLPAALNRPNGMFQTVRN